MRGWIEGILERFGKVILNFLNVTFDVLGMDKLLLSMRI